MFKKAFALASLTALTAVVASSMAAGCSSSSSTTTSNDAATPNGNEDGGGNGTNDGGSKPKPGDGGGTGDDSCYDESGAQAIQDGTGIGAGGECTDAQLDAFLSGCLGDSSSEDACNAATTGANETCAKCVLGGNGSIPPLLTIGQTSVLLNYQACIAIKIGKPECALATTNQSFCPATACQACDSNDQTASDACEKEAQEGICADLFADTAVPAGCAEAFAAVKDGDPAVTDCIGDGKEFAAAAKLTARVFCVETHEGGGSDAGSDAGQ